VGDHQSNGTAGWKICIVGSSKRFFSGITTHTIFLANALANRNQVSVILLRQLLPRFLFPGREHVGKDQYSMKCTARLHEAPKSGITQTKWLCGDGQ